jgi:hypothetical protein
MIARFFRHLDAAGVEVLLISGQATILYGAATFSEDVDVWVEPSEPNLERLMEALRRSGARYYKLTPALSVENLRRGHGFHFVLPGDASEPELFVDVMGKPPRVGPFAEVKKSARTFETDFGPVPTVGIKDLVELKKTQRAADYPVIGRLARAHLDDPGVEETEAELRWALDNTFGLSELVDLVEGRAAAFAGIGGLPDPLSRALQVLADRQRLAPDLEDQLDPWLEVRSAPLRRADRRYWRGIIEELREMRREGRLMREGDTV